MHYEVEGENLRDLAWSSQREWLLADGRGGFSMGTISGLNTRRYHGHLVAAVHPPTDRMVLLDSVEAFVDVAGVTYGLSTNQYPGTVHPQGYRLLTRFASGPDSVCWEFDVVGVTIRKVLSLAVDGVVLRYENAGKRPIRLILRPLVCHKPYHTNFVSELSYPGHVEVAPDHLTIVHEGIGLKLAFQGCICEAVQGWYYRFEHAREADRGLDPRDDLFCPCELTCDLRPGDTFTLTATAQGPNIGPSPAIETATCKDPLVESALQFLVRTKERTSIIAGYPWFTDWGRDTMISLSGVCLATGHVEEARLILADYASQMRQGLIPNRFVEAGETPEYNTVDASLWFVNAAYRTLEADWNDAFAAKIVSAIEEIVDWHRLGTLFGIKMDPEDGLITQGVPGVQLTWMDAKVGDWVVTPRHGKPVEINGLWINALRALAWITERMGGDPGPNREAADLAESTFHRKFWSSHYGWYFDTVDPFDAQLRPNQLIPLSLPFGPIDPVRAEAVLEACESKLLTPFGLRTLAPFELHYHGRYTGAMHELDAAYHQGTAWPWLLGIYWDAHLRTRGSLPAGRYETAVAMMDQRGIGGVAEVYDGDEPQSPNGCPWQAWSVATLLDNLTRHPDRPAVPSEETPASR